MRIERIGHSSLVDCLQPSVEEVSDRIDRKACEYDRTYQSHDQLEIDISMTLTATEGTGIKNQFYKSPD